MDGLDAWITGEGLCTYCGQRRCVCEPDAEDDERDPDDCMDCGVCDACVEQSKAYYEEMERQQHEETSRGQRA